MKAAGERIRLTAPAVTALPVGATVPRRKRLPVRPADHTRVEMKKHSDQYLFDIISKGGASVGKSAQMPAWGAMIKEQQILEIVGYIRGLSRPGEDSPQRIRGTK